MQAAIKESHNILNKDKTAQAYYKRYGFVSLDSPLEMFLPLQTIQSILERE